MIILAVNAGDFTPGITASSAVVLFESAPKVRHGEIQAIKKAWVNYQRP